MTRHSYRRALSSPAREKCCRAAEVLEPVQDTPDKRTGLRRTLLRICACERSIGVIVYYALAQVVLPRCEYLSEADLGQSIARRRSRSVISDERAWTNKSSTALERGGTASRRQSCGGRVGLDDCATRHYSADCQRQLKSIRSRLSFDSASISLSSGELALLDRASRRSMIVQ